MNDYTYECATAFSQLKALSEGWDVTLVTKDGQWRLTISSVTRNTAHHYLGSLSSIVARAYAGELGDAW